MILPTRTAIAAGTIVTLLGGFALGVAACKKAAPAPAPPIPEVVVGSVIQRDVPLFSEWVGTTEGFVNAQIYPRITGYLLKRNYKEGDHVKHGQLLFQIDDREYKAALDQVLGDLAEKRAESKRNQEDLARYKPLYASQVVSREQFDHVEQAARASGAAVEEAQAAVEAARLNLEWTQVTSPIDGIAGIAKAQVGDLVTPSFVLATVSQLNPIKVSFPISEREYLHFAKRIREHEEIGAAKDEPALQMILADGRIYKYPGRFYVANRQVNVQTGTIVIQAVFPNTNEILRPGLYAKIRAATDLERGALLVPQRAVLDTQGQYQVAVVGADNRISLRTVQTGREVGNFRIIKAGLRPGERIVTNGMQRVRDGMEVRVRLMAAPAAFGPQARPAVPAPPATRG